MSTKQRILDTALTLFNDHSTGAVSTNHIAEAMSISPGNLYYHYPNKAQIIEALFEQWFARTDVAFELASDTPLTLAHVTDLVHVNFTILCEYRFIYRELVALIAQSPTLQVRYQQVRQRGYDGFRDLLHAFSATGIMHSITDPHDQTRLADVCWLITEFWLPTIEVQGAVPDESHLQRGIDLMLFMLRPYLTR